jgi:hypothetical protein
LLYLGYITACLPSGETNAGFVEHFAKFLRFTTGFPSNGAVDGVPILRREHASPEFLECGSFLGGGARQASLTLASSSYNRHLNS